MLEDVLDYVAIDEAIRGAGEHWEDIAHGIDVTLEEAARDIGAVADDVAHGVEHAANQVVNVVNKILGW